VECRHIGEQGSQCHSCKPEELKPAVKEEILAWERAGRINDLGAFTHTALSALRSPLNFMNSVPWERGDLRTPLIFAILCGFIGFLAILLQLSFAPPEQLQEIQEKLLHGISPLQLILTSLLVLPLVFSLWLFFQAGITHLMLRLIDAAKRPFEATFRIFAYAQAASLLLLLPAIGPYAQNFYMVFFLLGGMRAAHQTRFRDGLLALIPILLQQTFMRGLF